MITFWRVWNTFLVFCPSWVRLIVELFFLVHKIFDPAASSWVGWINFRYSYGVRVQGTQFLCLVTFKKTAKFWGALPEYDSYKKCFFFSCIIQLWESVSLEKYICEKYAKLDPKIYPTKRHKLNNFYGSFEPIQTLFFLFIANFLSFSLRPQFMNIHLYILKRSVKFIVNTYVLILIVSYFHFQCL